MAEDWLRIKAEDALENGTNLPKPIFNGTLRHAGGERLIVSVTL